MKIIQSLVDIIMYLVLFLVNKLVYIFEQLLQLITNLINLKNEVKFYLPNKHLIIYFDKNNIISIDLEKPKIINILPTQIDKNYVYKLVEYGYTIKVTSANEIFHKQITTIITQLFGDTIILNSYISNHLQYRYTISKINFLNFKFINILLCLLYIAPIQTFIISLLHNSSANINIQVIHEVIQDFTFKYQLLKNTQFKITLTMREAIFRMTYSDNPMFYLRLFDNHYTNFNAVIPINVIVDTLNLDPIERSLLLSYTLNEDDDNIRKFINQEITIDLKHKFDNNKYDNVILRFTLLNPIITVVILLFEIKLLTRL